MKTELTLQEKLRDLREERKLKLVDVSKETNIPTSTLQRFESDEDARIGYQDVEVLTRFYGVSADYLFGLTDNKQYRNIEVDKLHLSDEAIAELASGKLNNRLLSLLIAHPDFVELLAALEVFVDKNISEYVEVVNKTFKVAVDTMTIKKVPDVQRDEYIATLQEGSIDPDAYVRFRLTQRFEKLAQSLYDMNEKEALSTTGQGFIKSFMAQIDKFKAMDEVGEGEQAKLEILADQMRVNLKKTTAEERKSMLGFLSKSRLGRLFKKRK